MMSVETRPADFFKAGGTLHLNAPSYITRPADDELVRQALAGQFCYVLTSRQRGKSSLMIRTADRLRQAGVRVAIIDLSGLGTQVTRDQWYLGMLRRLAGDLQLAVDPEAWWHSRGASGAVQRFTDFLHDVVLAHTSERIVVFLDEIDSTLRIDFSDDFFAAIRVLFNLRASSPEYDRLTFVLLGVAAPADLIKDRARTPFNIGVAIDLPEFSRADASPLAAGLDARCPGRGAAILDRIFHWTNGHPYLTQRLCLEIAEAPAGDLSEQQVDAVVERLFLADDARKENNLQYVRSSVEAIADRRPLMKLYERVYRGERVPEQKGAPLHERLRLIGLVRAEGGELKLRNEIYRHVFHAGWIKENTPRSVSKSVIVSAAVVIVLTLAALSGLLLYQPVRTYETTSRKYVDDFRTAADADVRLNALAQLCAMADPQSLALSRLIALQPGRQQARALFYDPGIDNAQRTDLFSKLSPSYAGDSLAAAIGCLLPVSELDIPLDDQRQSLTEAMLGALCRSDRRNDTAIATTLGGACQTP